MIEIKVFVVIFRVSYFDIFEVKNGTLTAQYKTSIKKAVTFSCNCLFFNCRGDRIRTCDPLLPKQMRYRAALRPVIVRTKVIIVIRNTKNGFEFLTKL